MIKKEMPPFIQIQSTSVLIQYILGPHEEWYSIIKTWAQQKKRSYWRESE